MEMRWNQMTENKFKLMIEKIPVFVRGMAHDKVSRKAEQLAHKENRPEVIEKDMVDAFFAETPFGFHGPMKTDMEDLGIDYKQFGYER